MSTFAATSTPTAATASYLAEAGAWLLLAALIAGVGYLALCWVWPFTACRRCKGSGKRAARFGRGFRFCPHCDGTGYRLRIGRHVLNYLRGIRRAAKH